MVAERTVTITFLGNTKDLTAALDKAGIEADVAGKEIGDKMDSASSRVGGAFNKLGNTLSNWGLPFGASIGKIGQKFDEADTKGKKFGQGLSTIGGALTGGLVVGAAAFGAEAVEMADKFDVAQSQLQVAVKNSGNSFAAMKPQIDASYDSMAKLGFNSTDTASALTTLTTASGSPKKAISDLGTAADLARMKHISLSAASQTLAKVFAGSTRALTQMGINLDIGSGKLHSIQTASEAVTTAQTHLKQTQEEIAAGIIKSGVPAQIALANAHTAVSKASATLALDQGTIAKIMDTVKDKTQGAAKAYGQTLAGQMQTAKAEIHNVGTQFGDFLIPKIADAVRAVSSIVTWLEKHKAVAIALAAVIGGVMAVAIGAFAINMGTKLVSSVADAVESLGIFQGAAEETGVAADSAFGPIGLAVMGVVVIGTLLVTHWKQVKDVLLGIWDGIRDTAVAAFDWIKDHLGIVIPIIVGIVTGGIGLLPALILTHWNTVKSDASKAWGDVVSFFTAIPGKIVGALSALGGDIEGIATKAWAGFKDAVVTGWNLEVDFWVKLPIKILTAVGDGAKILFDWGTDIIKGIVHGIESAASEIGKALLDAVKNGWNAVKSGINSIPVIGSALGAIGLATGGYVTQPTLALVGEAGPEFVIPEAQLRAGFGAGVQPLPAGLGGTAGGTATSITNRTNAPTVNQYFSTPMSPQQVATQVAWALRTAAA